MSNLYSSLQASYHAHKLTLAGSDQGALERSLASARVEMNPHQVDAALFALKSPLSRGVLLADEVGLGKTIEAGLVIAQRWAEQRRRIILIVPASLRKQWAQELWDKFMLRAFILDAKTWKDEVKAGRKHPLERPDAITITSYEFAARKADDIRKARWDLVVFDEAHRLRNVYKNGGSQRAKQLKEALHEPFKILLTATPLQNSLMELYGLVSIIDESHFGGEAAFRAQYVGGTEVAQDMLRERLKPVCHRTLRRQVQQAGHINFRRREARTFDFEPKDMETELYERLSQFLQRTDTVSYGHTPNQLVILQARKVLGSSTFAVSQYLGTLLERLRKKQRATVDMTDDVESVVDLVEEADIEDDDEDAIDPAKLAAEIIEVQALLELAQSIGSNAKGEKLLAYLPDVLDQIVAKGGERKAVIFTESVRTQRYLAQLLTSNGYEGQVVLMNGSNSDPESQRVYQAWRERHKGSDRISGSKSADMKAAIVEAFKGPDKTILIATESGAEGINLQFCSLLVNYDLPWNPQRVEQRIGRCHRYGQKIDVTVVNMLNRKNKAEERIHQLLDSKFHLFSGVFGASDEVLGTLMSGLDFEKEILKIVQNCRTEAEAEAEFDKLKAKIQDQIDEDMANARKRVLETLDADVINKLHQRNQALGTALPEFKQRLLMVARAELPDAQFHEDGAHFIWNGATYTVEWPQADEKDWRFFRANDDLGADLLERAKSRQEGPAGGLVFRPQSYPFPGQVAAAQALVGKSGWMRIAKARVKSGETAREELLVAAFGDDGIPLDAEAIDKLMRVPADDVRCSQPPPTEQLAQGLKDATAAFRNDITAENAKWLEEEQERLERYAADIEIEIDARIKELEADQKDLQKQRRNPDISMEDKVDISRKINRLGDDIDELKLTKFQRRKAARKEVEDRLDEFAAMLGRDPHVMPLMTIRWEVR
ncbi:MAG: DEAD/DEAH box helicase family protein [Alphaproteobacteria bacterium]|nr:DEAD/DEAH box helicase family protein [Alphaproteobacteria bacterium]